MDNDDVENEVVSRFRDTASRLGCGETITERDWSNFLRDKDLLENMGVAIVHCEIGESVKVWLLCRTSVALVQVQLMLKNNRLCKILINFFNCLLKRKQLAMMRLSWKSKQFSQSEDYFKSIGVLLFY